MGDGQSPESLTSHTQNHTQWPAPTLSPPPPHRADTPSASRPSGLFTLSQPVVSAHPCGSSSCSEHTTTARSFSASSTLGTTERAPNDGKRIERRTRSAVTEPRAMYIYRGSRYQALGVKQTEPPPASRDTARK